MIASSDNTVLVEGNHYFPLDSVTPGVLTESDHTSVCSWKGTASYYDVLVGGDRNSNAAFHYRAPKEAAVQITDRVAFWHGVVVTDD